MTTKEPVLLVVLIETCELRWFVAGIGLDGAPLPLMRSESGNLQPYLSQDFDEQVSFLRHRLCGVLQRGCDRLWGRQKKPCRIVFVADAPFADATGELTARVAEHFVIWMTSPAVAFFVAEDGDRTLQSPQLNLIAGEMTAEERQALELGLPRLWQLRESPESWELAPPKGAAGG